MRRTTKAGRLNAYLALALTFLASQFILCSSNVTGSIGNSSNLPLKSPPTASQAQTGDILLQDNFDRPNGSELGALWTERNEVTSEFFPLGDNPVGPGFMEIESGSLAFHYINHSLKPQFPFTSVNARPFVFAPLSHPVDTTPVTFSFAFSPHQDERIHHEVGLMSAQSGFLEIVDHPGVSHFIPQNSLGIFMTRGASAANNSSIQIVKYEGSARTILAEKHFAFQFTFGTMYAIQFTINQDFSVTVQISDGVSTERFSSSPSIFSFTLNQFFITDTEGGISSNTSGPGDFLLRFDDVLVTQTNTFNICLQDETGQNLLLFNSSNGEYQFTRCGSNGFALTGIGNVIRSTCGFLSESNQVDRRVRATVDVCVKRGNASIMFFPRQTTYTITDKNINDSTCTCLREEGVTPDVQILAADIVSDKIDILLSPANLNGNLVVTLIGNGQQVTLFNGMKNSGAHAFSFNPSSLAPGDYNQVRADWTIDGSIFSSGRPVSFRVLGRYRHSQYNVPTESNCIGIPSDAFITNVSQNGLCKFMPTLLRRGFIDQVNLNGSGQSIKFGSVLREFFCVTDPRKPPPGTVERSFRPAQIKPACKGFNVNDSSVARMPNHPHLECGDQILIVGLNGTSSRIKTVTDLCPGCPEDQLDNFTTDSACSGIRDLGVFVTIRLR